MKGKSENKEKLNKPYGKYASLITMMQKFPD